MASRHLRRVQQDRLGVAAADEDEESSDDEEPLAPAPKPSFASLTGMQDNDEDEEDEEEDEDEEEAVVELAMAAAAYRADALAASSAADAAARQLSNKERRARSKAAEEAEEEDDDAVLAAAAAASARPRPDGGTDSGAAASSATSGAPPAAADPWRLSAVHLDASQELGRKFGRETLKALGSAERRGAHNKSHDAAVAKRELALRAAQAGGGRARLIVPKETWPAAGGGLSMELAHDGAAPAAQRGAPPARRFVFVQSSAYRQAQREVDEAVEVGTCPNEQHSMAFHGTPWP